MFEPVITVSNLTVSAFDDDKNVASFDWSFTLPPQGEDSYSETGRQCLVPKTIEDVETHLKLGILKSDAEAYIAANFPQ